MTSIKKYYTLTKPGIIYGNLLSVIAGYFLGSKGHYNIGVFIGVMLGTSLVIASGCVFNNYIDRDIDKRMERTSKRALVSGEVSGKVALIYAGILGIWGFVMLLLLTNVLTLVVGAIGYVVYIVLYGWAKRTTIYGTLVGSISGAMPLVAGYTAVTGQFNTAALLLFFIMAAWQMPHFYSIGIFRLHDYTEAGLKIWPVVEGVQSTKVQIVLFVLIFIIASSLLSVLGYTDLIYRVIMLLVGIVWLWVGIKGFSAPDDTKWARKMFFFSLITLLILCATITVTSVI